MRMATISDPCAALVNTAKQFRGVLEVPKDSNRGTVPDFCSWFVIRDNRPFPMGGKAAPWCASFVGTVGRLAIGEAWPVPAICDVDKLVDWAIDRHVFHRKEGEKGDLIVLWYPKRESWGHVGLVTGGDHGEYVLTIEGNTNPEGSREGNGVYEKRRQITDNVAFIRWVDVLKPVHPNHRAKDES